MMKKLSRRHAMKSGLLVPVASTLCPLQTDVVEAASTEQGEKPGAPTKNEKDSFTIAVLPDTQNYCQMSPEGFYAQTQWLVDNKESWNIKAVLHLGDITNRNSPAQWDIALQAMSHLDGHVPYCMVPGNHDYSINGNGKDRTTLLNKYFPVEKARAESCFGGTYDKEPSHMENTYHLFTVSNRSFIVLALEFGPRADVVRWANEIVTKYSDREAILITHAYVYYDETRYDWKQYGSKQKWNPHSYGMARTTGNDVMDGEELWKNLICQHENFILTLNGHVLGDGLGRLSTKTPGGRDVHQMLVNFQMKPNGGDGWLRLLEFRRDRIVSVTDYSPTLHQVNTSPQNQFNLTLAPVG